MKRYYITIAVPVLVEDDTKAKNTAQKLLKKLPDGSTIKHITEQNFGENTIRELKF